MVTSVKRVLDEYEKQVGFKIKPDKRFYQAVNINQKRFGQLVRGEKEPFASEILTLSKFFNVSPNKLITNEKPGHYCE